jgi:hypothetical protein
MKTLDLLTTRLFDYAGMFPPAALSFEDALHQAARHPTILRRPWMVDTDMVVRDEHLPRLDDDAVQQANWGPGSTIKIALVGITAQDDGLAKTIHAFNQAHTSHPIRRKIVSVEPVTANTRPEELQRDIDTLVETHAGLDGALRFYLEPRWGLETWREQGPGLIDRLGATPATARLGLKVRCAGETALDHATMADILPLIHQQAIPLKATQGLHHPILEPQWDNHWGFLNLLTALRLHATPNPPDRERLLRLLGEREGAAYSFQDGLQWRDHSVTIDALQTHLHRVPFSIGSCSIQEPDGDLTRLFGDQG